MRFVRGPVALALFAVSTAIGCGYTDDEANLICQEELEARGETVQEGDVAKCFDCFKQCGDKCEVVPSSPLAFVCPG